MSPKSKSLLEVRTLTPTLMDDAVREMTPGRVGFSRLLLAMPSGVEGREEALAIISVPVGILGREMRKEAVGGAWAIESGRGVKRFWEG